MPGAFVAGAFVMPPAGILIPLATHRRFLAGSLGISGILSTYLATHRSFLAGSLGIAGILEANHAHGRQFDDALCQRYEVEDVAESHALIRRVQGGYNHHFAEICHSFGKLDSVGKLETSQDCYSF